MDRKIRSTKQQNQQNLELNQGNKKTWTRLALI